VDQESAERGCLSSRCAWRRPTDGLWTPGGRFAVPAWPGLRWTRNPTGLTSRARRPRRPHLLARPTSRGRSPQSRSRDRVGLRAGARASGSRLVHQL